MRLVDSGHLPCISYFLNPLICCQCVVYYSNQFLKIKQISLSLCLFVFLCQPSQERIQKILDGVTQDDLESGRVFH